jgi:serine protease Do
VWGFGVNDDSWNHTPYLLSGLVGLVMPLPEDMGFSSQTLGAPGTPVFNVSGAFVGWVQQAYNQSKEATVDGRRLRILLRDPSESTAFVAARDFLNDAQRIPEQLTGAPRPWLGVAGLQTLDKTAARFLELEDQGALIISDVIEGMPAAEAGLKAKDILVALNGQKLPKLVPTEVTLGWFDREVLKRQPGDKLQLSLNRDGETLELELQLGDAPMEMKEAPRTFFSRLGIAVRPPLIDDAIRQRTLKQVDAGLIASYLSPNKPASSAGLRVNDWIKQIDGTTVTDYAHGIELLEAISGDTSRNELILMVERGTETQVLRVKLLGTD